MVTKGRKEQVSLYLPPELAARLRQLSEKTLVPQSAYFREAVEELLKRHADKLRPATGKAKRGAE